MRLSPGPRFSTYAAFATLWVAREWDHRTEWTDDDRKLAAGLVESGDPTLRSYGEIVTLQVLVFAPDQIVKSGRFQMRYFDADGNQLDTIKIEADGNGSRRVQVLNDLPKPWIDPKGPWACRVTSRRTRSG